MQLTRFTITKVEYLHSIQALSRTQAKALQIRSSSFCSLIYLRQNRLQKRGIKTTTLPVLDELAVGALAGACSKFFTTPISNIVTRKQTARMVSARSGPSHTKPSVQEIISQIQSGKGVQGFWSGYSASLVLTLNPSTNLYGTFKYTLLPSREEMVQVPRLHS